MARAIQGGQDGCPRERVRQRVVVPAGNRSQSRAGCCFGRRSKPAEKPQFYWDVEEDHYPHFRGPWLFVTARNSSWLGCFGGRYRYSSRSLPDWFSSRLITCRRIRADLERRGRPAEKTEAGSTVTLARRPGVEPRRAALADSQEAICKTDGFIAAQTIHRLAVSLASSRANRWASSLFMFKPYHLVGPFCRNPTRPTPFLVALRRRR